MAQQARMRSVTWAALSTLRDATGEEERNPEPKSSGHLYCCIAGPITPDMNHEHMGPPRATRPPCPLASTGGALLQGSALTNKATSFLRDGAETRCCLAPSASPPASQTRAYFLIFPEGPRIHCFSKGLCLFVHHFSTFSPLSPLLHLLLL